MKLLKGQAGQSLIEFALVVPLLFLLIGGIIDLGRIMYIYMQQDLVTQEAVRLGGLGRSDAYITSFAVNYPSITDPAKLVVTISPKDSVRKSGDYVTVTLKEPITYVTPFLNNLLPSPYVIVTNSTIRVE
ncbi:TadE/TadG family type IV pilus assembly protein [Ferviditalea candida]|uniref:TadE/TadG family type IV pilus assembly protein n=1 Tax=Ferviditalea candida TaxID=3108399 RepID=A0ABU5ZDI2_9BACL|nr:TadE/TadG family type IV pilus assembly protein [Paenibacillaceae bacterium T2]